MGRFAAPNRLRKKEMADSELMMAALELILEVSMLLQPAEETTGTPVAAEMLGMRSPQLLLSAADGKRLFARCNY